MTANEWNVVSAILLVVLVPLAATGANALFVWARKTWQQFEADKPGLSDVVEKYVRIAVQAAEQAGAAKIIEDKKQYALGVACAWLEAVGVKIDIILLEAEIERQVLLQNQDRQLFGLREVDEKE